MNRPKYVFLTFVLFLFSFSTINAQQNELADKLLQHVSILAADSLQGRGLGTEGKMMAKHYIADHFAEIGLLPYNEEGYFQHFYLQISLARVPASNVIGYLPGSDPALAGEYILIGAHYDHLGFREREDRLIIYNGADDNASGVAAMMELARHFAENRDSFKRSLVFVAFDAEESGLLGAYHFVGQNELLTVEAVKAMFSLDMVGMYSANNGLDLRGIGSLEGGMLLARQVAGNQNLLLGKMTSEVPMATDTRPFGDHGIPAIQPFTGMKSPYHKPEDTYEKLDYEGMAKITVFMSSLITKMANSEILEPSKRLEQQQGPMPKRMQFGVLVSSGSSRHRLPDAYFVPKGAYAANVGLFAQLHFGKKISLQPEILASTDGSHTPEGILRRYAVTIPVNLHYNFINTYDGMLKIYIFGGGYYKHSLGGNNAGTKLDFSNMYEKDEWGFQVGLGLDVMKWQLRYYNSHSLTDFHQNPIQKTRPFAWHTAIGYRF